jgi:BMFP domain-containing protein YqiC
MSKGIFLRLQGETYEQLKKEANEKGTSVPSLIKTILNKYADGRLKLITPEEETLLKTRVELIPIKDKVEKLETYINEYMKPYIDEINENIKKIQDETSAFRQIIDHVMVLEQKLNSIEIRVKNLEKSKR